MSGGSEAVESAWKLARQYYHARDAATRPARKRAIGRARRRLPRHDDGRALDQRHPGAARAVRAARPRRRCTCATRTATTGPPEETEEEFTAFLLDDLEHGDRQAGPETVAMVIMEPVQNAGGAFTPPAGYWRGVREICDRYGILLCADEVITGFGRLGAWFASELYDIRPDLITCAKGLSSSYASIGAVIASDHVMEPFIDDAAHVLPRHHVRRAPGAGGGRAQEHRDHEARADRRARRASTQDAFRATLAQLLDLPIVGDLRGDRLLLRDRARQGQGDARDVRRRGVRDAAARLPLAAAVRARA